MRANLFFHLQEVVRCHILITANTVFFQYWTAAHATENVKSPKFKGLWLGVHIDLKERKK